MLWSINMKKTKKGPLSNKEKKYIENNLDSIKSDADKVAELMNRSVATIAKYINSLPKKEEAKTIKPGDLIARNEEMGVTVMTESASIFMLSKLFSIYFFSLFESGPFFVFFILILHSKSSSFSKI